MCIEILFSEYNLLSKSSDTTSSTHKQQSPIQHALHSASNKVTRPGPHNPRFTLPCQREVTPSLTHIRDTQYIPIFVEVEASSMPLRPIVPSNEDYNLPVRGQRQLRFIKVRPTEQVRCGTGSSTLRLLHHCIIASWQGHFNITS